MGINEILCKEYDAVRGEIVTGLSNRIRVLALGIAAIGLMWAAATALLKRTEPNREGPYERPSYNRTESGIAGIVFMFAGPGKRTELNREGSRDTPSYDRVASTIAGMIFVLAVPGMTLFVGWLWLGEYRRVQKAGLWQYLLEDRINKQAQQDLNEVKQSEVKRSEMKRSEVAPSEVTLSKVTSFEVTSSKVTPPEVTPRILTWEHNLRTKRFEEQRSTKIRVRVWSWVDATVVLLCLMVFVSVVIGLVVLGYSEKTSLPCLLAVGVVLFTITSLVYRHTLKKIRDLRVDGVEQKQEQVTA